MLRGTTLPVGRGRHRKPWPTSRKTLIQSCAINQTGSTQLGFIDWRNSQRYWRDFNYCEKFGNANREQIFQYVNTFSLRLTWLAGHR